MTRRIVPISIVGLSVAFLVGLLIGQPIGNTAPAQPPMRYKLAMVVLTDDAEGRANFEDGLAARLREHNYDAVSSYDIIPEVTDLDNADVVKRLSDAGVQAILMMRPAAVGPGSSLEAVKSQVSQDVYANMRAFARRISPSHDDEELVAVIHTAIYLIKKNRTELLSSGAVWLDEPVETREEGIEKLQNLIIVNMNKARPAIRKYLGLPPLPPG